MEVIERRIYLIRGQKVMLDSGLTWLYQVETFNLNKTDLQTQERLGTNRCHGSVEWEKA